MFVFLFIYFLIRCIIFSTAQVGSRLVELLVQTAYIQPPAESESDQSQDGGPDIRPAFVHSFRTMKEAA
jgi:DNA-directed RNA polymerase, mitochondrial